MIRERRLRSGSEGEAFGLQDRRLDRIESQFCLRKRCSTGETIGHEYDLFDGRDAQLCSPAIEPEQEAIREHAVADRRQDRRRYRAS